MAATQSRHRLTFRYIALGIIAVAGSWLLHEWAHWVAGRLLGYDMVMTRNKGYPASGAYASAPHYHLISAAGPFLTLLQAVLVFVLMYRRHRVMLYPFLFTCFYMRLLAAGMSIRNPNDEARISSWLGIGTFTLPLIVLAVSFLLVSRISKQYRFDWKFQLATLLLVIPVSAAMILADQYFSLRIL